MRWYWVAALLLALVLGAAAAWWFWGRAEPIRLFTPLAAGESYAVGAEVYLDDDVVGRVARLGTSAQGVSYAELEINPSPAGRHRLKEGLVRLIGQRALWLTSEFIESRAPPLVDGDVIPAMNHEQRHVMRWWKSFEAWIFGTGGIGVAWLFLKGWFRFRGR